MAFQSKIFNVCPLSKKFANSYLRHHFLSWLKLRNDFFIFALIFALFVLYVDLNFLLKYS